MRTVVLALCLAACASPPTQPEAEAPRSVREIAEWRVLHEGRRLGRLVLLEMDDPTGPLRYYRAENTSGQWVGFVDMAGRIYRRALAMDDQFMGIYPMEKGLALLYEVAPPVLVLAPSDRPTFQEADSKRQ